VSETWCIYCRQTGHRREDCTAVKTACRHCRSTAHQFWFPGSSPKVSISVGSCPGSPAITFAFVSLFAVFFLPMPPRVGRLRPLFRPHYLRAWMALAACGMARLFSLPMGPSQRYLVPSPLFPFLCPSS
ncbi:hypothetical protein V1522DRAFT_446024, partial [Lipomyces starkeyi]